MTKASLFHPLTVDLISQVPSFLPSNSKVIHSLQIIALPSSLSPTSSQPKPIINVINLTITPPLSNPYSCASYNIIIGGPGLGYTDPLFANYSGAGGEERAPVSVRFETMHNIAMAGVDELGFFPLRFFEFDIGGSVSQLCQNPTLKMLVDKVVVWFEGGHIAGERDDANYEWTRYVDARGYTVRKNEVIRAFGLNECYTNDKDDDDTGSGRDEALRSSQVLPALLPLLNPSHSIDPTTIFNTLNMTTPTPKVYTFPFLTPAFCASLIREIDAFEATDLPRRRPNTMNKYGLVVNEIGWYKLMSSLIDCVIVPLVPLLFPCLIDKFTGGANSGGVSLNDGGDLYAGYSSLDHHHSFIVEYRSSYSDKRDRGLDMHEDDSEVTMNVCLGRAATAAAAADNGNTTKTQTQTNKFTGSKLRFCGEPHAPSHRLESKVLEHEIGTAVLHLGKHRHGADNIINGERVNLIVWVKSSGYRANLAYGHLPLPTSAKGKGEGGVEEVDYVCLSKSNDRDYNEKVQEIGGLQSNEMKALKGENVYDKPVQHTSTDDKGVIKELGFDTFTKKAERGGKKGSRNKCTKF